MHLFLCFLLTLSISPPLWAMAAEAPATRPVDDGRADERFHSMDTDKKGFVSFEDFQKRYPNMQRPAFDAIDIDKNAQISLEEWRAFFQRHGMMDAMPPGRMPPPGHGTGEQSGVPLILPPPSK